MGLGKTLTVISLILTNFHDGRPLCKPELGYTRPPLDVMRPNKKGGRRKSAAAPLGVLPDVSGIGSKIKKNPEKKSAFGFFDKFKVPVPISISCSLLYFPFFDLKIFVPLCDVKKNTWYRQNAVLKVIGKLTFSMI